MCMHIWIEISSLLMGFRANTVDHKCLCEAMEGSVHASLDKTEDFWNWVPCQVGGPQLPMQGHESEVA